MLRKLFVKIALPVLGTILEEAMILIIEAMKDDSLTEKNKVRYVVDGLEVRMKDVKDKL